MRASPVLVVAALALASADAGAADYFAAALSGGQAVPSTTSSADGFGRVVLDEGAGTVRVAVDVRNLSANYTQIGLYGPAAPGSNGALLFSLADASGDSGGYGGGSGGYGSCGYYDCPPPDHTSEIVRNVVLSVTPAQIANLRAGQWYSPRKTRPIRAARSAARWSRPSPTPPR